SQWTHRARAARRPPTSPTPPAGRQCTPGPPMSACRPSTPLWAKCPASAGENVGISVLRLHTVDGFVVFDLDDCPMNAGGTRLAPDVTEREGELLARAMTYKFAVLHAEVGGAKGCVRGGPEEHD